MCYFDLFPFLFYLYPLSFSILTLNSALYWVEIRFPCVVSYLEAYILFFCSLDVYSENGQVPHILLIQVNQHAYYF